MDMTFKFKFHKSKDKMPKSDHQIIIFYLNKFHLVSSSSLDEIICQDNVLLWNTDEFWYSIVE